MKKLFLLFLFLLISTRMVLSQVSAGPIICLTFSNVKGATNDQPNKFKLGFRAGAFLKLDISDVLSLQPEVLYSTRGYKQKSSLSNSTLSNDTVLTHNFSYIDFPFILNINIGNSAYMNIGPQIGYIINAKEKGNISFSSNGSPPKSQIIDTSTVYGYNTTEYSLSIGGGYKFKFPLTASLRITYGITKLYEGEYFSHNLSFNISVAYVFGGSSGVGSGTRTGTVYKRF